MAYERFTLGRNRNLFNPDEEESGLTGPFAPSKVPPLSLDGEGLFPKNQFDPSQVAKDLLPAAKPASTDFASEYERIVGNRPQRTALEELMRNAPKREQYKPNKMTRLGAIIGGAAAGFRDPAKGVELAQNTLDRPFNEASEEYDKKLRNVAGLAGMESEDIRTRLEGVKINRQFADNEADRAQRKSTSEAGAWQWNTSEQTGDLEAFNPVTNERRNYGKMARSAAEKLNDQKDLETHKSNLDVNEINARGVNALEKAKATLRARAGATGDQRIQLAMARLWNYASTKGVNTDDYVKFGDDGMPIVGYQAPWYNPMAKAGPAEVAIENEIRAALAIPESAEETEAAKKWLAGGENPATAAKAAPSSTAPVVDKAKEDEYRKNAIALINQRNPSLSDDDKLDPNNEAHIKGVIDRMKAKDGYTGATAPAATAPVTTPTATPPVVPPPPSAANVPASFAPTEGPGIDMAARLHNRFVPSGPMEAPPPDMDIPMGANPPLGPGVNLGGGPPNPLATPLNMNPFMPSGPGVNLNTTPPPNPNLGIPMGPNIPMGPGVNLGGGAPAPVIPNIPMGGRVPFGEGINLGGEPPPNEAIPPAPPLSFSNPRLAFSRGRDIPLGPSAPSAGPRPFFNERTPPPIGIPDTTVPMGPNVPMGPGVNIGMNAPARAIPPAPRRPETPAFRPGTAVLPPAKFDYTTSKGVSFKSPWQSKQEMIANLPEVPTESGRTEMSFFPVIGSTHVNGIQPPMKDRKPLSQYDGDIAKAAEKYKVPVDLMHAIIKQESKYDPNANSGEAVGLMQFTPANAKAYGLKNLRDPKQSAEAGAHFISDLIKKYKGDLSLVIAAYNTGETNLDNWLMRGKKVGDGIGGKGLDNETKDYTRKVMMNLRNLQYGER